MQTCLFPWCSSQRRSLNASREYSSQRRYSIGQSYDVIFQWFQYHWFKSYCQYKSLLSHEHYNDCVLYVFSAKQWLVLFQMIWCVGSVSSVAVRTWRVTMLIHPTAAFFFFFVQNWDISSVVWCMMGVMRLYGSQPVTEGEKGLAGMRLVLM